MTNKPEINTLEKFTIYIVKGGQLEISFASLDSAERFVNYLNSIPGRPVILTIEKKEINVTEALKPPSDTI